MTRKKNRTLLVKRDLRTISRVEKSASDNASGKAVRSFQYWISLLLLSLSGSCISTEESPRLADHE